MNRPMDPQDAAAGGERPAGRVGRRPAGKAERGGVQARARSGSLGRPPRSVSVTGRAATARSAAVAAWVAGAATPWSSAGSTAGDRPAPSRATTTPPATSAAVTPAATSHAPIRLPIRHHLEPESTARFDQVGRAVAAAGSRLPADGDPRSRERPPTGLGRASVEAASTSARAKYPWTREVSLDTRSSRIVGYRLLGPSQDPV
jgi:hypothetical protein